MKIISFGEILWDIEGTNRTPGGAPANVAYHARQLGAESALISAVGDDSLGRELLTLLDRWGVDRSAVAVRNDLMTGTVQVTLDEAGHASYEIVQPVAWDGIPQPPIVEGADAIVFGTLAQRCGDSRRTLAAILDSLPPTTLRVYDVNLRPTATDVALVRASAARCDLLKLNDAEVPFVATAFGVEPTEAALLPRLREVGIRYIALTRGGAGSLVSDGVQESDLPAAPTIVADTIGAGDSFTAALIVGLLSGSPLTEAHRRASMVSAFVCSQRGATPTLPKELVYQR